MLRFIVAILFLFAHAHGSPTGAPTAACEDMVPNHGVDAQTSESPYVLSVSSEDCPSGATGCFRVSVSGATFRGFFMQARYIGDEAPGADQTPVGLWEVEDTNAQIRACSGSDNGVTHTANDDKDSVSVFFNPGENALDGLKIVASVVQAKEVFWVGQRVALN